MVLFCELANGLYSTRGVEFVTWLPHVTMLLIKDNPILRGGRTIGLKFYCLHAVTISGTPKRL